MLFYFMYSSSHDDSFPTQTRAKGRATISNTFFKNYAVQKYFFFFFFKLETVLSYYIVYGLPAIAMHLARSHHARHN